MTLRHRLLELAVMWRCREIVDEIHLTVATRTVLDPLLDALGLPGLKPRIMAHHRVDHGPAAACLPISGSGICRRLAVNGSMGMDLISRPPERGQETRFRPQSEHAPGETARGGRWAKRSM